jgi:3-hydroxyisobutyrate dehydrogenase
MAEVLPTVGFVGLGRMGSPMASRLAAAGYTVRAFDVTPGLAEHLASGDARIAATTDAAAVASGASVVILMVPNSDAVDDVLIGRGLLDAMGGTGTVIDMSSSEPGRTVELARRATQAGVTLIDAPVSGGVRGAERGTLTIMVGGADAEVAAVTPILEQLGSTIRHAGGVGAGHAVKALNNLMSGAHLLASSEAIVAGERFGLDPALMLEIVNGSSGRSGSTENKWPNFVLPETYDSGFGLGLMVKDMSIALSLIEATGTSDGISRRAVDVWRAAAAELPPDADHTEIARWIRARHTPDAHRGTETG